ncbi:MAG TPA: hypothetical protein VI318_06240 [Baekduia sp.]
MSMMMHLIEGAARRRRAASGRAMIVAAVVATALVAAAPAGASITIQSFTGATTNQDGSPQTQAGAHPYQQTLAFNFAESIDKFGGIVTGEDVKDIDIEMPSGFVGDPSATPTCAEDEFETWTCPAGSQVGVVEIRTSIGFNPSQGVSVASTWYVPLRNMGSRPGVAADFGFNAILFQMHSRASIRTGRDNGITISLRDLPQGVTVLASKITMWGVPADPSHDPDRGSVCDFESLAGTICVPGFGDHPASAAPHAFVTNPSNCSAGPLTTRLRVDTWQHPATDVTSQFTAPAATGCDKLVFKPTLEVQPDDTTAGAPSGYAVDLHVPQNDNPGGLATPPLKRAVVTLPAGTSVSPSSADGLQSCSPAQIGIHDGDPVDCPAGATIGDATLDTPLLPKPMTGSIYLATPHDNPSHSLLAMYLVLEGYGVRLKLPGEIALDPDTGRITATFDNNPQLPFTDLHLRFGGGPRAPLSNPTTCGVKTTTAQLDSWSGQSVTSSSTFTIDKGCDQGFTPDFVAGTTNPVAGKSSPFTLSFSRDDADRPLGGLTVDLPAGLLGRVAGVQQCGDADAAAGTCADASRVGSVTTLAGPGTAPFRLPGAAYLTGPYKGAPFGLSIVVPAVAGPLDLGNVVVRAQVLVDPKTAALRVVSDPLPTILQGIPLQIREVRVSIDRPQFMFNPTSCAEKQISATVLSAAGESVNRATRFQVGSCDALAFAPKLALGLSGKGQTTDGKHPGLSAVVTQGLGQANLKRVAVTLPLSLALDVDNAQALCSYEDGQAERCPASTVVGHAEAVTPLLDRPLTAPVYFVKGRRTDPKTGRQIPTLPTLLVPLKGQLALTLRATTEVVDDRIVATFDNIPDAAISKFTMNLDGGKHGILVVSGVDICKATQTASEEIDAQNGKAADATVAMPTPCALKVVSKKLTSKSLTVGVSGLAAGKLTVTGKGIKKTSRTIQTATVASITARRTQGRPTKVRVVFDPAGPAKPRAATAGLK